MDACVVGGAGYVGLITGLGLAEIGHHVINVDVDQDRIHQLQAGESSIYEDGIGTLLTRSLDTGRIRFSTDLHTAVLSSEVVFIAVGTPSREDGQADVAQVIQVAEEIVQYIDSYKLIVIKSTLPVGAVELVLSILRRDKREGEDFDIVANPEFLREGKGLYDFLYPDRIVIGTLSEKARGIMRLLYKPIALNEVSWPYSEPRYPTPVPVPVIETDIASAQMINLDLFVKTPRQPGARWG